MNWCMMRATGRRGDRLRLEVATVDAGTARLAVYRNGGLVFSHDETEDLIGGGRPGLGIGSDPALALDDWRGGRLDQMPPGPPSEPGPSLIGEEQDSTIWMANWESCGKLIHSGARDWWCGRGRRRALGSGEAYWMGNDLGPDHYSEIQISGGIGAWQGVMVRGSGSGMDCYVAAVKPDGVYLFAF